MTIESSQRILVIEDNEDTAQTIRAYLVHFGYHCDVVHSGVTGLELFGRHGYHLVLLDVMLPDLDGFAVCRQIRQQSQVPVIMLTAKVGEEDLVAGLDCGADEYVKKPYSNKELMARIKAHLRRHPVTDNRQVLGPYTHDKQAREISTGGHPLDLTKTEYLIFQQLLSAPGRVFSREQLFLAAFDTAHDSFERTVDVHIHNLRKKIAGSGVADHGIQAVYGVGYKLVLS